MQVEAPTREALIVMLRCQGYRDDAVTVRPPGARHGTAGSSSPSVCVDTASNAWCAIMS